MAAWQVEVLSAYDELPDEQYFPAEYFKGFKGNRLRYLAAAVRSIQKSDVVVFSHINLAPLMRFCQLLFPRIRTICMAHGREVWEPLTRLQSTALKACDAVWSVSQFTADILSNQKGISPARIHIFYNTLDPFFGDTVNQQVSASSLKERYGIKPGEKVILTVARLANTEQFKGYDAVLASLPAIRREFPDIRYVLGGKWEEAEKKRIISIINALKLHNVVILTGFIENSELTAHYEIADLFVLPSRKEGFGIVFLEAAWCGLPVIGGNRDGSREALLNGQLGILIDPEDLLQLENATRSALAQPLSLQQKNCQRKLVIDHFGFLSFKKRQVTMLQAMMSAE
jgi:glycosyltransferase involved in cell wall biosynthesis